MNWRQELQKLTAGNETYAVFNARIVNTKKTVIGVRVPDLRRLAKRYAKTLQNVQAFDVFFHSIDTKIFEEVMFAGLVIHEMKLPVAQHIAYTRQYLALVDSWAEVDIFVVKHARFQTPEYWDFACNMLDDKREFFVRYGVVMCMSNFLDTAHIHEIFKKIRALQNDAYYVKMACAWLYAEAAVNYYDETMAELARDDIDMWTRHKAYQKMLESHRIGDNRKDEIRVAKMC